MLHHIPLSSNVSWYHNCYGNSVFGQETVTQYFSENVLQLLTKCDHYTDKLWHN